VTEAEFLEEMAEAGRPVSTWSNGPGDCYASHRHPYRKYLCCLEGSMVLHTADGDVTLAAGDRMVLDAGTEHSVTVGPQGVRCAEAHDMAG